MIRYALVCEAGHEFESWFSSAAGFDEQARRGFVTCPACNSARVTKQIMAPNVARTDRDEKPTAPAVSQERQQERQPVALIDEKTQALRALMREMRAHIMENTTDVGASFPQEARKIHDGDAEARPIRGEASWDEARALAEDGIEVMPIPFLPDDRN